MGRAFQLLLFLHGWLRWEHIKRNALEEQMNNNRCDLCGLFGCRHVNPRLPSEPMHGSRRANLSVISPTGDFSVGERVGDAMDDFSGTVVDITEKRVSTIPMGPSGSPAERVIIPPPPSLPRAVGTAASPVNRELQQINMKDKWVNCNICKAHVFIKYLDQHLKVHTHNFEPSSVTGTSSSTAIVKTGVTTTASSFISSTTPKKEEEKHGPVLSKIEAYKFRELEQACCASSVSNDGRYSDFTIVFWEKDKLSVQSTSYVGGSTTYTTKDWERFSVHVVYDSAEDYYTLTCKLMKRGSYSTWDTEDPIPDRICFQEELIPEIKKALLFFKINPKEAYKHFLDLWKEPLVTSYDDAGRAFITQTKNCEILQERLKRSSTTSGGSGWSGYGGDCVD